ncbi:MAG: carboxypeptidase-like regulatory domain-containing protein, partial [Candidatus Neomarinimicrobiota bacterium]|nr:carboxypeptidase-like regulatory domain-containing protein [Candidatus Neomarinimicrobiota bacterium]
MVSMPASDVSGNIITFGDPYEESELGPFVPGDYPFEVILSAPAEGGDVTVDYYIGGDTWGAEPHSIEGSFTLNENIPESGDLMGYNAYANGNQHNTGIIGLTNYSIDGLTNNITHTLGVTAVYFISENETAESEAVTITASPTYLFGDITGMVTDPNGGALDSVIVSCGNVSDTTGENGTYTLLDLNAGSQTVTVSRSGFSSVTIDTAVLAQAEPTVLDVILSPDMPRPGGLEATPLDGQVHLSWRTPGNGEELILQYDDGILSTAFYFYSSYEEGSAHGMRFDVGGDFDVMAASVYVLSEGDEFWPWPDETHGPVRVLVFDDNNGIPGNLLYDGEAVAED